MITNEEQKRLKKEYKVIRGTYTVRVPDDAEFGAAKAQMECFFDSCRFEVEDHKMFRMWRDRK
jgi:hypothetical protein